MRYTVLDTLNGTGRIHWIQICKHIAFQISACTRHKLLQTGACKRDIITIADNMLTNLCSMSMRICSKYRALWILCYNVHQRNALTSLTSKQVPAVLAIVLWPLTLLYQFLVTVYHPESLDCPCCKGIGHEVALSKCLLMQRQEKNINSVSLLDDCWSILNCVWCRRFRCNLSDCVAKYANNYQFIILLYFSLLAISCGHLVNVWFIYNLWCPIWP